MRDVQQRHDAPRVDLGGLGHRPLLTVGLIALAATALALLARPVYAFIAAAAVPLFCLLRPLRRRWAVLLTAAVFLLSAAGQRCIRELPLQSLVGETDRITARVVETPRSGQMYTVEVLDAHRIPSGTRLSLYCVPGTEPALYDTIAAEVSLQEVPANTTYARSRCIFLYAFPQGEWGSSAQVIEDSRLPRLYALRLYFDRILRQTLPGDEGALLSALCLGQRHAVSAATNDAFRYSGLSHLLVVSGLHLSIVAVALRALLRRIGIGYRLSAALALPLVWGFAGMVGGAPSVLRAAIMCSVWLTGYMVYRRYNGLNAWGLAAALLLLTNPYLLLYAGFQLSFAATAGVLTLAPRLCRPASQSDPPQTVAGRLWQGVRRYIRNGCGVCIGAMLFTLPLTVFYYYGLSITALPANLLAVVPAGWALTVGWLGMLCGAVPFLGWLSHPLLLTAGCIARWLQWVSRLCGPQAAFVLTPHLWQKLLIAALCVILACAILCRAPWRRVLAVIGALTLCVGAAAVPLSLPCPRLTVIPCREHAAMVMQDGDRTILLVDHSGALRHLTYTLEQQGITRLDALYIDQGAPADGGSLMHLWEQYGYPAVHTADEDIWYGGLAVPVTLCTTVSETDHPLTLLIPGWWRWESGSSTALLCTDPTVPRPTAAAMTVYAATPPMLPDDGYCVVVSYRDGTPPAAPLNRCTLLLTEETCTLAARADGEWSVLPWL